MAYRLIWLENVGCVDMQTNVGVLYMLPCDFFRKDPDHPQGPYGKNPAPREKDRVSITSSTYPRAGAYFRVIRR